MNAATVCLPGTCGELVQGLIGDSHFLVSLPIDLYSTVTVEFTGRGRFEKARGAPKASEALRLARPRCGAQGVGIRLTVSSAIPRSKGMGSSTADVAGAVYALWAAIGGEADPQMVAEIALAVEPTDSSVFPGLCLFDHRRGTLYERLGSPPPMEVLVLDCGGEVDTVAFNATDRTALLRETEPLTLQALALVIEGMRKQDVALIGKGATLSARAHQAILPKPPLEHVIALAEEMGAAGVNVAHSGTVIGVLFGAGQASRQEVAARFKASGLGLSVLGWHRVVGGGCRVIDAPRYL